MLNASGATISRNLTVVLRASKRKSVSSSSDSSIPPPPPTVAPPPVAAAKPKIKQAYRSRKKTDEERQQEQAARQQRSPGRTRFLDAEDLLRKHAAIASTQPVSSRSRSVISKAARNSAVQAVVLIDGYNLLHFHPSTKQLMQQDRVEEARSYIHQLLSVHAEHGKCDYYVIYDATSVPYWQPDVETSISPRVTAVYKAGQEADSVIISTVQQHHTTAWQEASAGVSYGSSQQGKYLVYTNDTRIQQACNNLHIDAARVWCHRQHELSHQLQRIENRLNLSGSVAGAAAAAAAAAAALSTSSRPHIDHDTHAWAEQMLAKRRAQEQQQRWQQQQEQQQRQLQASQQRKEQNISLSDEELLQKAKAEAAAAAGGASHAAPASPAAASTTGHLDELLSMDLDSLLLDSLEDDL